ncbi:hypothetical protein WJX72_007192 [[Myrmecia] bisecta]|uniref:Enoyl reductase (ER) domain-containing protein n=1 Tax=[Myrmecia] bisecta TaxID=41462 RepID=A0AAW1R7Q0_9CHLO
MTKQTAQKAVQIQSWDKKGFSGLGLAETPVPEPGPHEVLVRVYLRPCNPTDIFSIQQAWPDNPDLPAVPGSEGVGKVEKVGPGVTRVKPGQRVVAAPWPTFHGQGTWQQYVVVPEKHLVLVPDEVPDQEAAQFWINPVTVYGMLDTLQVPKGEYLLQTAAGSTLGREMIAYAKHVGVKTINLVRRGEQKDELKAIGADEVLTFDEDVVGQVMKITGGKGAYGAIDAVGGEVTEKVMSAVRPKGTVLVYGAMSGPTLQVKIFDPLYYGKILTGWVIYFWIDTLGERRQEVLNKVMDLIKQGVIKPYSGKAFPLEKYDEAIKESQKEARGGKVFLEG